MLSLRVIPEGKILGTFWSMIQSRSWDRCLKDYHGGQEDISISSAPSHENGRQEYLLVYTIFTRKVKQKESLFVIAAESIVLFESIMCLNIGVCCVLIVNWKAYFKRFEDRPNSGDKMSQKLSLQRQIARQEKQSNTARIRKGC